MTDKTDPRILAAMYRDDAPAKAVAAIQERITVNEQSLEPRRNVTIIKINKQAIAVPTVGHVHDISKEVDSLKLQINKLASENRQLKLAFNKMSNHITKLAREIDNKIDKL
jgi:peptidoglycan hydrolase CwlO-like protein